MASAIFQPVICPQCGEREAIIFIRRSGDSEEGRDIVLCESCAAARGIMAGKGNLDINIDDLIGAALDEGPARSPSVSCPSCGIALAVIKREGRLGCPSCADFFSEELAMARGRKVKATREGEAAFSLADLGSFSETLDSESFPESFPLPVDSFSSGPGPEDDVVLWSSAWIYRDIEGLPFPGSPRGCASPSRSRTLPVFLGNPAWSSRSMASLGAASRRSLAERGIVSRLYAADDEAPLLSASSSGSYALLDEGDHIRIRSLRPGLDLLSALGSSLVHAESLGASLPFALRPCIGWICSRLDDCGFGSSLSALVHIPGLVATGMRERLFRALMAEGFVLRGFYSTDEDSSASVYEICAEGGQLDGGERPTPLRGLCDRLAQAATKIVGAERRAREKLQGCGRDELLDAEGRAYGILRSCRLLEAEEAASLLSTLRLAALRGSLVGVDPRALGSRMLALGPGSVSLASAESAEPAESELSERSLRASLIKRELSKADYKSEGGSLCSKA